MISGAKTAVSTLLSSLKRQSTSVADVGSCFMGIKTPVGSKNDYSKLVPQEHLIAVLDHIDKAILTDSRKGNVFSLTKNAHGYASCAELSIIQGFSELEFPLDFNQSLGSRGGSSSSSSTPSISTHDTLRNLIDRTHAFFQSRVPSVDKEAFSYTLNALSKLDLDASAALRASANGLIQTVGQKALAHWKRRPWNANHSIHLLWGNAVTGLQLDGTYTPSIGWKDVKIILDHIENELIKNKFTLSPIQAKQLFQVYAANYSNKNDFPQNLLLEMQHHISSFAAGSHGSTFEDRVQLDFNFHNGVYNKLKTFHLNKSHFNARNPITDFGLETDILFSHKDSGVSIAIQVDGREYHTFPSISSEHRKVDLRTRFRDFCFAQAGIPTLNLDGKSLNYGQQIVDIIANEAIYDIQSGLQRRQQARMEHDRQSTLTKLNSTIDNLRENLAAIRFEQSKVNSIITPENIIKDIHTVRENALHLDDETASHKSNQYTAHLEKIEARKAANLRALADNASIIEMALQKLHSISTHKMEMIVDEFHPRDDIKLHVKSLKTQKNAIQNSIDTAFQTRTELDKRIEQMNTRSAHAKSQILTTQKNLANLMLLKAKIINNDSSITIDLSLLQMFGYTIKDYDPNNLSKKNKRKRNDIISGIKNQLAHSDNPIDNKIQILSDEIESLNQGSFEVESLQSSLHDTERHLATLSNELEGINKQIFALQNQAIQCDSEKAVAAHFHDEHVKINRKIDEFSKINLLDIENTDQLTGEIDAISNDVTSLLNSQKLKIEEMRGQLIEESYKVFGLSGHYNGIFQDAISRIQHNIIGADISKFKTYSEQLGYYEIAIPKEALAQHIAGLRAQIDQIFFAYSQYFTVHEYDYFNYLATWLPNCESLAQAYEVTTALNTISKNLETCRITAEQEALLAQRAHQHPRTFMPHYYHTQQHHRGNEIQVGGPDEAGMYNSPGL